MKTYGDQIIQHSINGSDVPYRELKCRWKNCGRTFESHTFENECPRCRKMRVRLQNKCHKDHVPYSNKVLEVALKLLPAFPNSRWHGAH